MIYKEIKGSLKNKYRDQKTLQGLYRCNGASKTKSTFNNDADKLIMMMKEKKETGIYSYESRRGYFLITFKQ